MMLTFRLSGERLNDEAVVAVQVFTEEQSASRSFHVQAEEWSETLAHIFSCWVKMGEVVAQVFTFSAGADRRIVRWQVMMLTMMLAMTRRRLTLSLRD